MGIGDLQLSTDKFSNFVLHVAVCDRVCNKLYDVFVSKDFTRQWSCNTSPLGEALVNLEARFVQHFIHNFPHGYFLKIQKRKKTVVSLRDRLNYVNKERELIFMILRKKH